MAHFDVQSNNSEQIKTVELQKITELGLKDRVFDILSAASASTHTTGPNTNRTNNIFNQKQLDLVGDELEQAVLSPEDAATKMTDLTKKMQMEQVWPGAGKIDDQTIMTIADLACNELVSTPNFLAGLQGGNNDLRKLLYMAGPRIRQLQNQVQLNIDKHKKQAIGVGATYKEVLEAHVLSGCESGKAAVLRDIAEIAGRRALRSMEPGKDIALEELLAMTEDGLISPERVALMMNPGEPIREYDFSQKLGNGELKRFAEFEKIGCGIDVFRAQSNSRIDFHGNQVSIAKLSGKLNDPQIKGILKNCVLVEPRKDSWDPEQQEWVISVFSGDISPQGFGSTLNRMAEKGLVPPGMDKLF